MAETEPAFDAYYRVRWVRVTRAVLVVAGVLGAVVPALVQNQPHATRVFSALALGVLSFALVPLAYVAFAYAVTHALRGFLPESESVPRAPVALATLVCMPCVGAVIEVVVLYLLAKQTARLEGVRDRSGLVVGLSLLRAGLVWTAPLFVFLLWGILELSGALAVAVAVGPLASFVLLGVMTQLIAAPLIDQLEPEHATVRLGAASATSSMAVPSVLAARDEGEGP